MTSQPLFTLTLIALLVCLAGGSGCATKREEIGFWACENHQRCAGFRPDGSGDCFGWERGSQSLEYLQCVRDAVCLLPDGSVCRNDYALMVPNCKGGLDLSACEKYPH